MPVQQNFPLMDYYISYDGKNDESTALKVSVKSKLSVAKEGKEATGDTNTIKFDDLVAFLLEQKYE